MKRFGWLCAPLFLLAWLLTCSASAQLAWDKNEFMGIDEVKAGMVGYGKTVFQGTKVESFDVEVVGVLRKIDFGFDMVLIKVTSGPLVDKKLQTISGMSGSPIYIDDRLIGAYAYGWDFQQEAVAGVTPIAAMLECSEPGSVVPPLTGSLVPANKVMTIGKHLITRVKIAATHADAVQLQTKADPTTMVMTPVTTPLFVNGMAETALPAIQKLFNRYNVRAQLGPGAVEGPSPKLEAGSAVAISLMEGDANMSAVGTVTYVKGNTVLAFGHPFFGLGTVDMPMSTAFVHGIIGSNQSSFKLASPIARVGKTVSDRQFAVAGTIGAESSVLPVSLFLNDPARKFTRRYAADLLNHPDFTPALLYLWILYNGAGQIGDIGWDEGTFTGRMVLSTDKLGEIEQNITVAPRAGSFSLPFGEFYQLADALMMNPYEPVKLTKAFIDLKYAPERNTATIEKVTPDRPIVHPGESVNLTVDIRPYGKPVEKRTVSVMVPKQVTEPAMLVLVAGGALGPMLKPLFTPEPTPEEGMNGVVRWLTDNTPANSIVTARVFPSPSINYRGQPLRDVPMPIYDVLRFAETGAIPRTDGEGGRGERNADNAVGMPTIYIATDNVPYVLSGGAVVTIAIETEDRVVQTKRSGEFDFIQLPVLSTSLTPGRESAGAAKNEDEDEDDEEDGSDRAISAYNTSLFTPYQRARYAMLSESITRPITLVPSRLTVPKLRVPGIANLLPLSLSRDQHARAGEVVDVEAQTVDNADQKEKPAHSAARPNNAQADDAEEENDDETDDEKSTGSALLTRKQPSWGLTTRQDFLSGKHLGTGVSSQGNLMLVPSLKSIFQTTEMVPWKMVTTAKGTYVAGWGSNTVLLLAENGASQVVFPKQALKNVRAVTALAADADGNLLVGTWPDQCVRLVTPDGTVRREWKLPGTAIWDLAVTQNGKRYAGCDAGTLFLLRDTADVPLQVAANVPDKHVYTLTPGPNGELYLGTSPRGKVYRLSPDGALKAVFETLGAVTSIAFDAQGNVYAGSSPNCRIVRVSRDGTQQEIMRGMGRGNRHLMAMTMIGDTLYAATGPAGGIYMISQPAGQQPEVTPIFAREDLRNGTEEADGTGPESVMVNALAVNVQGELLIAASSPAQVLKLVPRSQGAFLSTVRQAPTVARWGQIDAHLKRGDMGAIMIESRSGSTAVPDDTWSGWQHINADNSLLTSPAASFVQFRVRMAVTPDDISPAMSYVRLFYTPTNQAPMVRLSQPKPGAYWSGRKDIRWEARDPDDDELTFTVYTSRDNGRNWSMMMRMPTPDAAPATEKKADETSAQNDEGNLTAPKTKPIPDISATSIPWDTNTAPDGPFRIRVVATDKYAKPAEPKEAEVISGLIIIDNTPPTTGLSDKVYGWDNARRFVITDATSPIVGGKYSIDDGPWTALVADDGIFDSRQEAVVLLTPIGEVTLTKGEHKLAMQAQDSAGNLLDRTVTLAIGLQAPKPTAKLNIPPVSSDAHEADLAAFMLMGL